MTPEERYRRIDGLLDQALELEGAARAAFLDRACGDDRDLRRDVDALIASHESAGSFLTGSAMEASAKALAGDSRAQMVGRLLGPYPIRALLGAGGMGEVYRAHDPRLGRDVAIKILPTHLAADRDALARFEREARAIAALSHANITAIHDFGSEDGIVYAVMELLEGETLRQRLAGGRMAWRKAVQVAIQIAEGLAAAHAAGIVHRDLKPENISLGASNHAKILDFGLARVAPTAGAAGVPRGATEPGTLMGTVGYMSPEQVRGEDAGPAADIFSFGCVLYEMLSGAAPFAGNSRAEDLTRVLRDDPAPLGADGRDIPPVLEALVLHCLEKRAQDRFQSASDLAFALRAVAEGTSGGRSALTVGRTRVPRQWLPVVGMGVLGLALGLGSAWIVWRPTRTPAPLVRLTLPLSPGSALGANENPAGGSSVAVSQDGRWIAYIVQRSGERHVALRGLDRAEETILSGTRGAWMPFFSPDGQWIAFFTQTALRRIPIAGGTPTTICSTPPVTRGATWADNDVIYFTASFTSGLTGVPARGGPIIDVTAVDLKAGESNHLLPDALPGGETVLFTVWKGGDFSAATIWSVSLRNGERRLLLEAAAAPRYVPPGFLVFARGGGLFAVRFDAERLVVTGDAVPVIDGVWTDRATGTTHYAISRNGTVVYALGGDRVERHHLAWVDRQGRTQSLPAEPTLYTNPRLSPDGRHVAVEALNDLWVYDLKDNTLTRVTFRGVNQFPVWSPDGRRLAYSSSQGMPNPTVLWTDAETGSQPEPLGSGDEVQFPTSWTKEGNALAYSELSLSRGGKVGTGWDIWLLHPGEAASARSLIRTEFNEEQPTLSPDGRTLAYVSDEADKQEVYVRPFPDLDRRTRISVDGGTEPVWSRNGRELFYRRGRKYFAVGVMRTDRSIQAGRPQMMFEGDFVVGSAIPGFSSYDVGPDGRRFMVVARTGDTPRLERLEIVLGWRDELERRLTRQTVAP